MKQKYYYKLTTQDNKTHNNTMWGENITHTIPWTKSGNRLCTPDVIHVYAHPLLAVLFNPIHANIIKPKLWLCKTSDPVANDQTKIGVKTCTTLEELPVPEVSNLVRVHWAILSSLETETSIKYKKWANAWLNKTDRTAKAASAVSDAAYAASDAAYASAAYAVSAAAYASAAYAASAAAYYAYDAAYYAYDASDAAAYAAYASAASAKLSSAKLIELALIAIDKEK